MNAENKFRTFETLFLRISNFWISGTIICWAAFKYRPFAEEIPYNYPDSFGGMNFEISPYRTKCIQSKSLFYFIKYLLMLAIFKSQETEFKISKFRHVKYLLNPSYFSYPNYAIFCTISDTECNQSYTQVHFCTVWK